MNAETPNPFKPGAGRVPPELAGRDEIIQSVERVMSQVLSDSEGDRPIVVSGLRGVGKTVLLNEFVRRANRSRRWIAVKVEATRDRSLAQGLTQELHTALRQTMSIGDHAKDKLAVRSEEHTSELQSR